MRARLDGTYEIRQRAAAARRCPPCSRTNTSPTSGGPNCHRWRRVAMTDVFR